MKFQSSSSRSWCALIISSMELNPQDLTTLTGITPEYLHPAGISDSGESLKGHWQLNSTISEELPLEDHIWDILKRIAPVRKEIKESIETAEGIFYCSTEITDSGIGGFQISSRVLKLIGDLGASLQIHTFKTSL
jgi:hypothetical protein